MTIIFNEADRNQTAIYNVKGCEKMVIIRGASALPFNLTIESVSLNDPHSRPLFIMSTGSNMDVCIGVDNPVTNNIPCLACGQKLIFKLDSVDPQAHVFVEILYETCVPEKCCNC